METFQLRKQVAAVQYHYRVNEAVVAALVKGQSAMSYDVTLGYMHFYNDGPEVTVQPEQWVLRIGDGIAVLSDEAFQETFAPTSGVTITEHPLSTPYPLEDDVALKTRLDAWLDDRRLDGRDEVSYNEWKDRVEIRVVLPH